MKKFIAIRDCLTADKDYLTKGNLLEDFDEIKDSKLLELGLVEEFDEVKHSKFLKNNKNSSNDNELLEIINSLKKDLEEKNDFISNSEIPELKALVEEKIAEVNEKDKAIEGLTKESEDLKVLNQNQTLDINEKNEGIAALMVVIEELKSLVEEATTLPKGQIPEGFVKYKES